MDAMIDIVNLELHLSDNLVLAPATRAPASSPLDLYRVVR